MLIKHFMDSVFERLDIFSLDLKSLNEKPYAKVQFDALVSHRYCQGIAQDPGFLIEDAIALAKALVRDKYVYMFDKGHLGLDPEDVIVCVLADQRIPLPKSGESVVYELAC